MSQAHTICKDGTLAKRKKKKKTTISRTKPSLGAIRTANNSKIALYFSTFSFVILILK